MNVAKIDIMAPKEYFISDAKFAQSNTVEFKKFIDYYKPDCIVNVSDYPITKELLAFYKKLGISKVLYYPLEDTFNIDYKHLESVLDSIYVKLGQKNLIHCTMGINRSALVIAYSLFKSTNFRADQIINFIKYFNLQHRKQPALINPAFVDFLKKL
jgi:hypothetical protein